MYTVAFQLTKQSSHVIQISHVATVTDSCEFIPGVDKNDMMKCCFFYHLSLAVNDTNNTVKKSMRSLTRQPIMTHPQPDLATSPPTVLLPAV